MIKFEAPFEEWYDAIKEDLRILFKDWRVAKAERHDKHYFVSLQIAFFCTLFGFFITALQFKDIGVFPTSFIVGFAGWCGNLIREQIIQLKHGKNPRTNDWNVKFDYRDCRFGGYGAWHGALLGYTIALIILYVVDHWLK